MGQYQEIENAKEEINRLTSRLTYFKNEERKKSQITMINTFITLINICERLLSGSIEKEYLDAMLLYVFEMKYDRSNDTGGDGFISIEEINMIRRDIKFRVDQGRDNQIKSLALRMAVDTMNNSSVITEEDKLVPLTNDDTLLRLTGDCASHWEVELQKFIDYCHSSRVVWN